MGSVVQRVIRIPGSVVIGLIKLYQLAASPFPSPCRYTPTCSMYAIDAILRYGVIRGCWMSTRRILRCHPFASGGYDPVK